jgi:dephospho-CoA kinase
VARFGRKVLRGDGSLDRAALGRIVFDDAAARRDLEAIVHPLVQEAMEEDIGNDHFGNDHSRNDHSRYLFSVSDIPLLYEAGRDKDFERVVVAACRADQQLARLMARDGLAEADARARLAAQLPIDEKARRADYVIDTSGTVPDTDRRVLEVFERLKAEAAQRWVD